MKETKCQGADNCDLPVHSKGFCQTHYMRFYRYGADILVRPQRHNHPCLADDCGLPAKARGYCQTHYLRVKNTGTWMRPTLHDIIWSKFTVNETSGCWEWNGAIGSLGYGSYSTKLAHRLMYEDVRGPIPEALVLDHLCRVRHCVNPDHLEPVTLSENVRRGAKSRREAKMLTP